MCGVKPRIDCRLLYKELQIMPLPSIFIYQLCIYVKNNYHEFSNITHYHIYNIRAIYSLEFPRRRLTFSERL